MSAAFISRYTEHSDVYFETDWLEHGPPGMFRLFVGEWITDAMGVGPGDKISFDFGLPGQVSTFHREAMSLTGAPSWTLRAYAKEVLMLQCVQHDWLPHMGICNRYRVAYVLPGVCGFVLPRRIHYKEGFKPQSSPSPSYLSLPPFSRAVRRPYEA